MGNIKYMDIDDFRKDGYLHELNRRFLHPLGLALEVRDQPPGETMEDTLRKQLVDAPGLELSQSDMRKVIEAVTGWAKDNHMDFGWVSGVWDYREDPEGMIFGEIDYEKISKVREMWNVREPRRRAILGFMVQDREISPEEYERLTSDASVSEGGD